jgi:hypothetical protein
MTRTAAPLTDHARRPEPRFSNLFLVDGATFPFLPAKNLTFNHADGERRAYCGGRLLMSGRRFVYFTTFLPAVQLRRRRHDVQRTARALVRRGHQVTVVHDTNAYEWLFGPPDRRSARRSGRRRGHRPSGRLGHALAAADASTGPSGRPRPGDR